MSALKRLLPLAVLAASFPLACAALTIDQYYLSNAVLQRGVTLPVSGTATVGTTVTVGLNGASASAKTDANGRWRVAFPAQQAGGPYALTASDGTRTLMATNVLVGDVWLVAGQSNAFFPIERFAAKDDWLKDADYPRIRFITVTYYHPVNPDPWQVASSATAGKCSAMGFFFAKALQASVDVPMGIVVAAKDGSVISSWQVDGQNFKSYMLNDKGALPPFPVKGALWYQGEADGMFAKGYDYRFQLQRLIRDWRTSWNAPDMPFIVVQLPHCKAYALWYEVRDSQNWVAAHEKNVSVVPTLDIGDLNDIHPPRKPELGERLSLFARKYIYGDATLHPEGPVFRSAEVNPDNAGEMLVHFDVTSAIKSSDGQPLKGFQVGGDYFGRLNFFEGTVRIVDEDTVAVSCEKLKAPTAVRYGFSVSDTVNFFDADGNPARAFRSDTYKLPTQPNEASGGHGED